ncbi:MAG: glycosyltransferase [Pseudonocardiales bacterium]|nr:glycosyltransferase [Pseudonocardiales bacterium]
MGEPRDDSDVRVGDRRPKIGILVVAYNAESTLRATLDRIPDDFHDRIDEILICDDASDDGTFDVGIAWRAANPAIATTVIRHKTNLGYGGNQKVGFQLAIDHGLDIIVLLHGDGQYAPECLPQIVEPLVEGDADAVFGSRMLVSGSARRGGMPLYKYVGNRVLTGVENRMLGSSLSEFHSGYRAYRVATLAQLPLQFNTDAFDFDTQIIIQLLDQGHTIVEVPIPTYYGDEICYVDGLKYAYDVVRDVVQYRLTSAGIGTHPWVPTSSEYDLKAGEGTSHTLLLDLLRDRPPGRVLDLGCSGGQLSVLVRELGNRVTGVDSIEIAGVRDRVDEFHLGNLEAGIPEAAGSGFDVVIAADVIEHVADPGRLLRQMAEVLAPDGVLLISTPNFGHWYSRGRVTFGAFDYDRRGILDETHLRFFSRRSLLRLIERSGLAVAELQYTGLPIAAVSDQDTRKLRLVRRIDRALITLRPTLFAFQFVARIGLKHTGSIQHGE